MTHIMPLTTPLTEIASLQAKLTEAYARTGATLEAMTGQPWQRDEGRLDGLCRFCTYAPGGVLTLTWTGTGVDAHLHVIDARPLLVTGSDLVQAVTRLIEALHSQLQSSNRAVLLPALTLWLDHFRDRLEGK